MPVPICRDNQFLAIGQYIKRKRKGRGLDQKQLAELSRVNIRYIRLIEQGVQPNPRLRHVARLLQYMGYELVIVPIRPEDEPEYEQERTK
jgi:transcriptional regulator with XRE-family HTH domain